MESFVTAWVVFLFASFSVSVLALTYVQVRGAARYGWRGLRNRPFLDTYWRELSMLERCLLWPGLAVFALTWLGGGVWALLGATGS